MVNKENYIITLNYIEDLPDSNEIERDFDILQRKKISSNKKENGIAYRYTKKIFLDFVARFIRSSIKRNYDFQTYPIIPSFISTDLDFKSKNNSVLNLIIESFPVPDDRVTFDEIFNFKEKYRSELLEFRAYIVKLTQGDKPCNEIINEINRKLLVFEEGLKNMKIKYRLDPT
nr:DUF6236 family protein [uncultured Sulfurimonas sp.]